MPMKVREVIRLLEKHGWGRCDQEVAIEPTATGYSAFSPDVPGCAAAGHTKEQTRRNFEEALAAHFDAMREIGERIPEPSRLRSI